MHIFFVASIWNIYRGRRFEPLRSGFEDRKKFRVSKSRKSWELGDRNLFFRDVERLSQLFSSFLTFTTNLKKFPTDGSRKKRPKELNLDRLGNIINNNKFNNKIIHNFDFQCRYSTLINQVSLFLYNTTYIFFSFKWNVKNSYSGRFKFSSAKWSTKKNWKCLFIRIFGSWFSTGFEIWYSNWPQKKFYWLPNFDGNKMDPATLGWWCQILFAELSGACRKRRHRGCSIINN